MLRAGVIGVGFGAEHVSMLQACPGVTVDWLCYGSQRERAIAVASRAGVPRVSDDLGKLLGEPVDLVVVASPPSTHLEYGLAVLAHGARLVVDKPLATTAREAERLADSAEAAGQPGLTFFQWRADPAVLALRSLIRSGKLGRLQNLHLEFRHNFLAGDCTEWAWRHIRGAAGAGALGDLGVHMVDLWAWLLGDAPQVLGSATAIYPPSRTAGDRLIACETEDWASALLRSNADPLVCGQLFVSRTAQAPPHLCVRVTGEGGVVALDINPETGERRLDLNGAALPVAPEAESLYARWLRNDDSGVCATLRDGARAQQVLDAIAASVCDPIGQRDQRRLEHA